MAVPVSAFVMKSSVTSCLALVADLNDGLHLLSDGGFANGKATIIG